MAEAHMIDVISFKPVKYRLTDKGREFYEEFFIGGALDLQGPEIEKIFNEWSKRREMKGGKRWKE
jgi:DNA-binding PadR family transcriptional regulator